MHNKLHFDKWAGDYDETILKYIDKYPFERYYDVLATVVNKAEIEREDIILDIGIGTGTLSKPLYEKGYKIIGLDFSEEMLKKAKEKMPNVTTIEYNMKEPSPKQVKELKPNKAITTYAFHHLNISEKVGFIKDILFDTLSEGGILVIGDVSFENKEEFQICRNKYIKFWDEEEDYLIVDELLEELEREDIECRYTKIGECAGVLVCKTK